ncbi:hypothetical protein N665_0375s0001 [Sinapis alba]|nr:hypothetical protein N665_0375s0001 [Sinapis alba]
MYVISFKTSSIEEIIYSFLKKRICKKIAIEPCSNRMNLSNIPLVVEPKRQSYILDDEDLFVYLTSVIKELEIVLITEQQSQSKVEKVSSDGGNYSELASGIPEVEGNPSALTPFTLIEEVERYLEGIERVENIVNGKADDGELENVDNSMGIGAICEYVELPYIAKEIPMVTE